MKIEDAEKWLDDLAVALKRSSAEKGAEAAEVAALFRRIARKPRPRRRDQRMRLLQAIADSDQDYQNARAEGSHQAADRSRRHKQDLEEQLADLDKPKSTRAATTPGVPGASRVEFLERHLAEVEADMVYLRATEQWSLIPPLDARACVLRGELDDARAAAGANFKLDRNPAAVAAELLQRWRLLRQLAECVRQPEAVRPIEIDVERLFQQAKDRGFARLDVWRTIEHALWHSRVWPPTEPEDVPELSGRSPTEATEGPEE